MVASITDVLNVFNEIGIFSYVIPFLLIFAIVYAILDKTKILGEENKGILAIISVSVGLLSLQFDFVSNFFAVIFPRFGIGLSLFLVLIIMVGFFFPEKNDGTKGSWIGMGIGVGVVIWALSSWNEWTGSGGFGGWFSENAWAFVVLGIIVAIVVVAMNSGKKGNSPPRK